MRVYNANYSIRIDNNSKQFGQKQGRIFYHFSSLASEEALIRDRNVIIHDASIYGQS